MFCKNCGAQLPDGAKYCKSCGVAVRDYSTISDGEVSTVKKVTSKKNPLVLLIAAIVAVVVFVIVFSSGNGYEKTVDCFFDGLFGADSELFISTLSNDFIEEQLEYYGYRNKAVLIEKTQDNMDDLAEEYVDTLGKNWKYQYEIVDVYEGEDEVEVTIDLTLSGRKGEESDVWILVLIKDGNKWYVDSFFSA